MARKRPSASDEQLPAARRLRSDDEVLTRAELHALSRSAPLSKAEFKAHRTRAETHIEPLRSVLDSRTEPPPPGT